MANSDIPSMFSQSIRQSQRAKRHNYHLLNDGSDNEAVDEGPPFKKPRLPPNIDAIEHRPPHSDSLGPEDSASQSNQAQSLLLNAATEQSDSAQISDTESHTDTLSVSKKPKTPRVGNQWLWAQFEITNLSGQSYTPRKSKKTMEDRVSRCIHCDWSIRDSTRLGSTSNMKYHLATKHHMQKEMEEVKRTPQPSVLAMLKQRSIAESHLLLERNLLQWIVREHMPFTTVETASFRQIFADIPHIELPITSRDTLKRRIDTEFETHRDLLKKDLATTCQSISLTLDAWTSKNHKAILGVIGHWLTEDFEYRERVLEFREIIGVHSGENMAEMVADVLKELDIERKLLTITGDNASNNETMVSDLFCRLQEKFSKESCTPDSPISRFGGLDSYVRCLAHVLNLIVSEILSTLKTGDHKAATLACDLMQEKQEIGPHSATSRLRIMALWIARIPQRRQFWQYICQSDGLSTKFIEYDVDTRWNSFLRMLKCGLAAKTQIAKWIESQSVLPVFTAEDWHHVAQVANILEKFEEFTLTVSSDMSQMSLSIPIYYELHDMLHDASDMTGDFKELDEDIARAISKGLEKYKKYYTFMDEQDIYYVALVLDPRFKTLLIEQELETDTVQNITNAIKDVLDKQYPAHINRYESIIHVSEEQRSHSIGKRLLQKLQPQRIGRSDIERYFDEEVVTVSDSVMGDAKWLLNWWRINKAQYPRMAAAARDYLSIQASEVAVERLFNKGRDLLGLRRQSMSADTMRKLTLLRDMY
jgi:hypothetical protein